MQVIFTVVIPVHPAVREVGWRLALAGMAYLFYQYGLHATRDLALATHERVSGSSDILAQRGPVQLDFS
jgi:hypothetical protein